MSSGHISQGQWELCVGMEAPHARTRDDPQGTLGGSFLLTFAPICEMGQLCPLFLGWSVGRGPCLQVEPSQPAWEGLECGQVFVHPPPPRLHSWQRQLPLPWDRASAGRALGRDRTPCSLEELHFLDWPCASEGLPKPRRWSRCRSPERQAGPEVAARPRKQPAWTRPQSRGVVPGTAAPQYRQTVGMTVGENGWQGRDSPSDEDRGLAFDLCSCPLNLAKASPWAGLHDALWRRRGRVGGQPGLCTALLPVRCGLCSRQASKQVWAALRSPQAWNWDPAVPVAAQC